MLQDTWTRPQMSFLGYVLWVSDSPLIPFHQPGMTLSPSSIGDISFILPDAPQLWYVPLVARKNELSMLHSPKDFFIQLAWVLHWLQKAMFTKYFHCTPLPVKKTWAYIPNICIFYLFINYISVFIFISQYLGIQYKVCPEGIQPCNMKNKDLYWRRYKKHCT